MYNSISSNSELLAFVSNNEEEEEEEEEDDDDDRIGMVSELEWLAGDKNGDK